MAYYSQKQYLMTPQNWEAKRKKTTAFVKWLKRQIKQNKTPIVVFVGETRSGKTAFAMRSAWEVYPDKFSFKNVAGTVEEWFEIYDNTDHNIIILDEASVALFVYDWNSPLQKVFSHVTSTQAYKYNIVFLILPQVQMLAKLFKHLPVAVVEMKRYGENVFYKFMVVHKRYSDMNSNKIFMTHVGDFGPVPLPPPHVWDPYITKGQGEFKERIAQNMRDLIKNRGKKSIVQEETIA